MAFENGVDWKPLFPEKRGAYKSFSLSVDAVVGDFLVEKNQFFDYVFENWSNLFPGLPVRPGRYEAGVLYLYVSSIPVRFAMEGKLRAIRQTLQNLECSPKRLRVLLETRTK